MDSRICLTPFTRDFTYLKTCDIWSSNIHFERFKINPTFNTKPTNYFIYSSKFGFRNSKKQTFNLNICLIYEFKPIVVKIIPFNCYITTVSFSKDPFRPILFIGQEDGNVCVLNLENLNDIKIFRSKSLQNRPVIISDWLSNNLALFAYSNELYCWNIETGEIKLIYENVVTQKIKYLTCSSFNQSLVAIGNNNGLIVILREKDTNFEFETKFVHHKNEICCLSFTVSPGQHRNPILASICANGWLCIWNLDRRVKLYEDRELKNYQCDENYKYYTCAFIDDLYELEIEKEFPFEQQRKEEFEEYQKSYYHDTPQPKQPNDSSNYNRLLSLKKEYQSYFILFATDSNGIQYEYKVPKYLMLNTDSFLFKRKQSRMFQPKFTRIYSILMPRSFQINLNSKPKKGDSFQQLINNNNYPIMIQIGCKNSYFYFLFHDLISKRLIQELPLLANSISSISFNNFNTRFAAIPDTGGFLIWKIPDFKSDHIYQVEEKRRGFFRKFPIRVTCVLFHPEIDSLLAVGTRTGLILICNLFKKDPIELSYQFNQEEFKSLYIYDISWGPNILDDTKPKNYVGVKKTFDYLYILIDSTIMILNITTKKTLRFIEVVDVFIAKKWTELCWKKDYKLLAVGNDQGSVDIFHHSLIDFSKLKHILTLNDLFCSPIECIIWHPITSKPDLSKQRKTCNYDNVIAISSTENVIIVTDLKENIEKALQSDINNLPLMVNEFDKKLVGHTDRVYRLDFSTFQEKYLLSTSEDCTIKIWDCKKDKDELILTYYGHTSSTQCAKWSLNDPNQVISGGFDSIVAVWYLSDQTNEKPKPIEINDDTTIKVINDKYIKQLIEEEDKNVNLIKNSDIEKEHSFSSIDSEDNVKIEKELSDLDKNDKIIKNAKYVKIADEINVNIKENSNEINKTTVKSINKIITKQITTNNNINQNNLINGLNDFVDKSKRKKFKKIDNKVKSLLTISTCYDNNLSKLEHFNDFNEMINKFIQKNSQTTLLYASKNLCETFIDDKLPITNKDELVNDLTTIKQETKKSNELKKKTYLLYGDCEDVENLSNLEINNHLASGDHESALCVKLLCNNLRETIEEAIKSKTLNELLVSMSATISLNYYQRTVLCYIDQLVSKGKIVIASTFLLSLFKIKEAIDLLIEHRLFKEALMIAKTRFSNNQNVYVIAITKLLADNYSKTGNYESEAKCWLSIDYYYEAARVLASRLDPLSIKYSVRLCKIAFKYNLEN